MTLREKKPYTSIPILIGSSIQIQVLIHKPVYYDFKTYFYLFADLGLITSCERHTANADRVVIIQPFTDFNRSLTTGIFRKVKAVNTKTILKPAIALPHEAYYNPRKRYRAEKLIFYLSQFGNADTVVIGLTEKDISTTKGTVADWGIMGFGYCPGSACVVSTYRLKPSNRAEQFYKLVLHELGHTQGLPHCKDKSCFMRDAKGGNPLNNEKGFCSSCKHYLKKNGWNF